MGFNAEVLRVLIASPSDVHSERDEIERVIFEWNTKYAEQLQIILLPSRWENDITPAYAATNSQDIINEQLVNKCDILVGIFWTKLGTPTSKFSSGTLEEINIFIGYGKEVMVYFKDSPIPRNTDFEEVKRVDAYKNEYGKNGIYAVYDVHKIVDHLYKKVVNYKMKKFGEEASSIQFNSTKQKDNSNISIEQIIRSGRLTDYEILLLAFILDTGNRQLGFRWMEEETFHLIKKWESTRSVYVI